MLKSQSSEFELSRHRGISNASFFSNSASSTSGLERRPRTLYEEFRVEHPEMVRIDENTAKHQESLMEAEAARQHHQNMQFSIQETNLMAEYQEITKLIEELSLKRQAVEQKLHLVRCSLYGGDNIRLEQQTFQSNTPEVEDEPIPVFQVSSDDLPNWSKLMRSTEDLNYSFGTCIKTLKGHSLPVTSIDYVKQFDFMLSASQDQTVRLWDLSRWECVKVFRKHSGPVNCVRYDGDFVCSASSDKKVRFWRVGSLLDPVPQEDTQTQTYRGHLGSVHCVQFSIQDGVLVSGAADNITKIFDIQTGQCIDSIHVHSEHDLIETRESSSLQRSRQGLAQLSYPAEQEYQDKDQVHNGINTLQFESVGALATGGHDGMLRMYDMRASVQRPTIELNTKSICNRSINAHSQPITKLQFDGYSLMSSSLDRSLKFWDMRQTSSVISDTMSNQTSESSHSITGTINGILDFQFDERQIVVAPGDESVVVYDKMKNSKMRLEGHHAPVNCVKFVGNALMTGGADSVIKIYEL